MTYYDSAKDVTISPMRVIKELERHGIVTPQDMAEFYKAFGIRKEYNAQAVLVWLGY